MKPRKMHVNKKNIEPPKRGESGFFKMHRLHWSLVQAIYWLKPTSKQGHPNSEWIEAPKCPESAPLTNGPPWAP